MRRLWARALARAGAVVAALPLLWAAALPTGAQAQDLALDTSFNHTVSSYSTGVGFLPGGQVWTTDYDDLLRLNPDGTLDLRLPGAAGGEEFTDLEQQPDGKLLAGIHGSGVVRFNPDGSVDSSFSAPKITGLYGDSGVKHVAWAPGARCW